MQNASKPVEFLMTLGRTTAALTRKFDATLGGIGFSEFMILYHLSHAEQEKMRRVDLAEKVGLTASGVTRLLLPMEKIGLVKKEADSRDGRVSYVQLARGGKQKLDEAMERAEIFCEDKKLGEKAKKMEDFAELLDNLV